jgi:putative hydrolase of the HAD superfamily
MSDAAERQLDADAAPAAGAPGDAASAAKNVDGTSVAPRRVAAVISDFGGVLTSSLQGSFEAYQEASGVPLAALGMAMAAIGARLGVNPLFELETGRMSEADFLAQLGAQLSEQLGRTVDMAGFGEGYFSHLTPNEAMIGYMRRLRERGYKLAICTNNVREWAQRWRAMLPVDEIFEVVVDSAFVGARKPEPRIYELTLEALGVDAGVALLIDDIEANCDGARAVGIEAVWFESTEQAIADVEAALQR